MKGKVAVEKCVDAALKIAGRVPELVGRGRRNRNAMHIGLVSCGWALMKLAWFGPN